MDNKELETMGDITNTVQIPEYHENCYTGRPEQELKEMFLKLFIDLPPEDDYKRELTRRAEELKSTLTRQEIDIIKANNMWPADVRASTSYLTVRGERTP